MNPTELHRLSEWPFQDILFSVAGSDDGKQAWVGSSDARVYELDLSSKQPAETRVALEGDGHSSYVTGMARTEKTLITCSYDRKLIWWDLESRRQSRVVEDAHSKWIRGVTLTPDGTKVISFADDMRCRVWDVASGKRIADFSDHAEQTPHHYPSMLYAAVASQDGKRIATADRVGHVAIWNADTFEKESELEAPVMYTWDPKMRRHSIGGIRSLAFSGDGKRLAVGGIGKIGNIDHLGGPARMEVFDLDSGDRLLELEDNKKKGLIEQIVWGPDDQWILTTGGDNNGFITIYEASSGKLLHQADQNGHIHGLWRNPDWSQILLAGHQKASVWSLVKA